MLSRFHLIPESDGQTDRTAISIQYCTSVCSRAIKMGKNKTVMRISPKKSSLQWNVFIHKLLFLQRAITHPQWRSHGGRVGGFQSPTVWTAKEWRNACVEEPTAQNLYRCFALVLSSAATRTTFSGWIPTWPITTLYSKANLKSLRRLCSLQILPAELLQHLRDTGSRAIVTFNKSCRLVT